jgi:hypothetical protein
MGILILSSLRISARCVVFPLLYLVSIFILRIPPLVSMPCAELKVALTAAMQADFDTCNCDEKGNV